MTFIADTDPFDILGGAAPQTLACRLRVRNVADDADLFIVSTVPGDDLPYLAGLPTGDGQEFNPLDGTASIGAYQVEVVDAPDGSSYAVTQYLTDANGFQQLPSVRAFLEFSTDGGAAWTAAVIPGFVNSYKLVTANRWSFTIGDSRRADQIAKVFASTTAQTGLASVFNRVTMMIGGPIRQQNGVTDFAGVRDYGGWIFKVINVLGPFVTGGDLLVALEFEAGVMPGVLGLPFYAPTTRGLGGITTFARNRANQLAAGAISQAGWNAELGQFVLAPIPDVTVEVLNLDGTVRQAALTAMVMPTGDQTNPWGIIYPQSGPSPVTAAHGDGIGVTWPAADAPSVGDKFVLYAWRNTIDESNPLHIIGHPVDIVTALWDEVGIAYDATAAAAVKQELGADAQLTLRITQAYVLKDFLEQAIFGPLGLQARIGDSGERVLFTTRIISENIPATTVTLDDLRDPAPPIFAVDEQSIVNLVTTKTKVFQAWNAAMPVARPPDDVATFERIRQFDNGDPGTLGPREQVYEVPGTIAPFGTGQQPDDRYDFALAHGILDRFGRGGLYTELKTTPDIDLALGEEFVLDVPHLPNLNVRGGDRILQVVRKTVVPGAGFDYLCLDSGTTAQFTTGPTFTVAANADDPKRRVDLTITNAATLNAAGASVRVEWAFGVSSPTDAGQLAAIYGPLSDGGAVPTDPVTLPRVDAGSTVWVRLRSMIPGQRPSAFTSWLSVDLTDLTAPSSVTYTPDGGDGALIVVTFTPGDTDVPVELWARPDGTGAGEERLVLTIPAAATQGQFTIDAGTWIFDLRHHETAPYNGQSADDEQTMVVTATLTLPAPVDPNGYSTTGSPGDTGYDPTTGLYHPIVADDPSTMGTAPTVGLAVRGTIFPSSTEFWMASETAPGSGTPGSYAQVGTVASVQGDWTALTVAVVNDGLKRYLKARHIRDGATDSAFTSAVECDPSLTVALLPFGTIAPGGADTVPVSDGVIATYQKITNAQIDNAAAIAWSKISKTGSSLADLATRSATDLTSGTLDNARLASSYAAITSLANLTTVGALASGSIAAGFGNINNASNSLTTGALTATSVHGTGVATFDSGVTIPVDGTVTPGQYYQLVANTSRTVLRTVRSDSTFPMTLSSDGFKQWTIASSASDPAVVLVSSAALASQWYKDATPTKAWGEGWSASATNAWGWQHFDGSSWVEKAYLTTAGGLNLAGALTATTGTFSTSVLSTILDSNAASDLLLKRNGATKVTVGASGVTLADTMLLGIYTVSNLPASPAAGTLAIATQVTGASLSFFGIPADAGAPDKTSLVMFDGSQWRCV